MARRIMMSLRSGASSHSIAEMRRYSIALDVIHRPGVADVLPVHDRARRRDILFEQLAVVRFELL